MKRLYNDDSAVSIAIGFILTFAITILTFTAVMHSSYVMMEQTEQKVMREEFEIHGQNIALQLTKIDTIVRIVDNTGGEVNEIRRDIELPLRIANNYYNIEFSDQAPKIIFESNERYETRVEIPYNLENTNISNKTISSASGDHYLLYNRTANLIEVY